jgi:hypothetical protein
VTFDLGVWHEPEWISSGEASAKYRLLCEGQSDGLAAHPGIAQFVERLTAKLSTLPSEGDDGRGWWATGADVSDHHVLLRIQWQHTDVVSHLVYAAAEECGLVCYDPQLQAVALPPGMPGPQLVLSIGARQMSVPSTEWVATSVRRLLPDYGFIQLERRPHHFLRAAHGHTADLPDGTYAMEYRDGSPNAHFRCETTDNDTVSDVFESYARGDSSWRQRCEWQPRT